MDAGLTARISLGLPEIKSTFLTTANAKEVGRAPKNPPQQNLILYILSIRV